MEHDIHEKRMAGYRRIRIGTRRLGGIQGGKEVILAEQRRDLEAHLQDHLLHLLESLHDQAQERIHTLLQIDKPQLEEQAKIKRAAMERIHTVLAETLQERIAMVEEKPTQSSTTFVMQAKWQTASKNALAIRKNAIL